MNGLSWLIYFADLSGGLAGFAGFAAFLSIVGFAGWLFYAGLTTDTFLRKDSEKEDLLARRSAMHKMAAKYCIPSAIIFGLIAAIIPSRQTIMFIAVSQYGERLGKTEVATKAYKALDKWLSDYLNDSGK